LSTIRVDKEALGYAAARALIEGQLDPGNQLFGVSLVVRESSLGSEQPPIRPRAAQGRSR
jgi:DNA-binding LacI/PurR family transcriptional regulator